jgi:hypothetical protein
VVKINRTIARVLRFGDEEVSILVHIIKIMLYRENRSSILTFRKKFNYVYLRRSASVIIPM